MRYQEEIEAILKISEVFGSKVLSENVLGTNYVEGVGRRDLASLGQKLADISALIKHNIKITRFLQELQKRDNNLRAKFSDFSAPEKTLWVKVQKSMQPNLEDSSQLLESGSRILNWLREDVESILTNSGHCDPADLYPYLEKGSQDQIVILEVILERMYPNGRENHIVVGSSHNTAQNQNSTNELPNMSLDSKGIENEAPRNDMITVDLKTQDTQLDPKQKPIPEKVIETEAPKDDMMTVDLNTLDPKPNPMPTKTMTPRYKFKRIKKGGKVKKIQFSGVHKMKFKPPHKITDSQKTPIKSPNISGDSTVPDTGIPKSDSSQMVSEVQDTKQNYKTKALKMSKGSMPQMSLIKRRGKCGKVRKIQTPRMYKKKLKSQLDMRTQGSLKSMHNNNARLHNNTLNTKFIELRGIMESVMGTFHNTFPLLDRLLLKRPRVKIK